jgi:hypothetical protein
MSEKSKMAKCPFCQEEMKRRAVNIQIDKLESINSNTITIKYDNNYTCRIHGLIQHPNQSKRVELE